MAVRIEHKRGTTIRWACTHSAGDLTGKTLTAQLRHPATRALLAELVVEPDADQTANPGDFVILKAGASQSEWPLREYNCDIFEQDSDTDEDDEDDKRSASATFTVAIVAEVTTA